MVVSGLMTETMMGQFEAIIPWRHHVIFENIGNFTL